MIAAARAAASHAVQQPRRRPAATRAVVEGTGRNLKKINSICQHALSEEDFPT